MPEAQFNVSPDLVSPARLRSAEGRRHLFGELSGTLVRGSANLTPAERRLTEEILCQLLSSVEVSVRLGLAEQIADMPEPPRDLAIALANDAIEVATPVILRCTALTDNDLLDLIRARDLPHQLAVAVRENIGEAVTEALVEIGDPKLIEALVDNLTARISTSVMCQLIDLAADNAALHGPLSRRRDIDSDNAKKLYLTVSLDLKRDIYRNFDLQGLVAEPLDAVLGTALNPDRAARPDLLIGKLHAAGQLTAGFLVKCLRDDNVELFELGLARRLNMAPALARHIVRNGSLDELIAACRAISIDRLVFGSIFDALAGARASNALAAANGREAVLAAYGQMSAEDADRILTDAGQEFQQRLN
ncbi:DUF2336 domain-containing protein [Oceanibacterium hippocampi]|uniref:DUF2336 domain-containing protein n=1 Tax=Oceanibacterium hippocampi TaxID=745714 RepID=UPI000A26A668|nr:DUF2336 domain-containing protein [Oceanibacterium hippocampi]